MSSNEPTEEPIIHPFISLGLGWPKSLLIVIDQKLFWFYRIVLTKYILLRVQKENIIIIDKKKNTLIMCVSFK